MSDGMLQRAAKAIKERKAKRMERLEEILQHGETRDDTSQRVQGEDVKSPPLPEGLMKSEEEGSAELEKLRAKQRARNKK